MPKKSTKESGFVESQVEYDENSNNDDDETVAGGGGSTVPEAVRDQKVNDIVRYILSCQKKGIPVKRSDISKEILKNYKRNFLDFFNDACTRLDKIFGLKVHELENKRNNYIVVNNLPSECRVEIEAQDAPKLGLLGSILTFLFMTNAEKMSANEKNVLNFLRKLGVDINKTHSTFGDVKQLLTREFVQKNYLQIQKIPAGDGHETEWSWGERASYEFTKLNCLEMYCRIYKDTATPESWMAHFKEATKDG